MEHRLLPVPVARFVVLTAVVALAAACSPAGDDIANGGLVNTSWTVLSIAGAPTLPASRPTMAFAPDGTVSGTGGCNQYSGQFRTDGDKISVGAVSSTLMGCDGERGLQEGAFLSALQGATIWRQAADGNLHFSGAADLVAGPGVAEGPPDEPPAAGPVTDLTGTSWTLHELGGAVDFAHIVPTLVFGADGTLSGFAGCNQFNAPYAISGTDIKIGSITTTKMGCDRPASLVEASYLQGLAGVRTWWTDEIDELHLDGDDALTFAPG